MSFCVTNTNWSYSADAQTTTLDGMQLIFLFYFVFVFLFFVSLKANLFGSWKEKKTHFSRAIVYTVSVNLPELYCAFFSTEFHWRNQNVLSYASHPD